MLDRETFRKRLNRIYNSIPDSDAGPCDHVLEACEETAEAVEEILDRLAALEDCLVDQGLVVKKE